MQPNDNKPIGPIIGALIIVLILIAGALYMWGQKLNVDEKSKSPAAAPVAQATVTAPQDSTASIKDSLDTSVGDLDSINF